jgi:hypothetical protein
MPNGTPFAPIADDEAPTAFYRRRKRAAPAPAPTPTPSPSPATLLLPTSEARDVTSDGTILAPRQESEAEVPDADRGDAWARLVRYAREVADHVDTTSALAGVVAFAFFGLLGVGYVYIATSSGGSPATVVRDGAPAAGDGAVAKALELSRRLRRAHGYAEVRHVP